MSDSKLIITIENRRPVELNTFVASFQGIGLEYNRFINKHSDSKLTPETKLYIQEVRAGSIVAVLTDLAPIVIPFVEHAGSIVSFTKFLKKGFDYLLGKTEEKPEDVGLQDFRNMGSIIEATANDNGSSIVFNATEGGTINFNFSLNSIESNAIQNNIAKELLKAKLIETGSEIIPRVLMTFVQVRNKLDAKSGTKGLVDSISNKALNVIFADNEVGESIIATDNLNPFTTVFVVDVSVETAAAGVPVAYKVHKLHDRFPLE